VHTYIYIWISCVSVPVQNTPNAIWTYKYGIPLCRPMCKVQSKFTDFSIGLSLKGLWVYTKVVPHIVSMRAKKFKWLVGCVTGCSLCFRGRIFIKNIDELFRMKCDATITVVNYITTLTYTNFLFVLVELWWKTPEDGWIKKKGEVTVRNEITMMVST